ncbi:exosortase H-associated membrane protein [Alicycliphilus sp. T452]
MRFALYAFGAMIVLTLLWTKASPWLSYPVGWLSHAALEQVAPMWVRSVHQQPGQMEVDTTVEIVVPQSGGRRAEVTLDADPGRYAFGLPIFHALLFAAWAVARAPGRAARALLGYALLLPAQAFSLVMYLLMQLAGAAQFDLRALRVEQWQLEAIVYGYQVGVLVLPTLAPVLVWLLLDRKFFTDVIVHGWKRALVAKKP